MATRNTIREHAKKQAARTQAVNAGVKEIHLDTLHEAQLTIVQAGAKVRVVCCGRRFGKSTLACNETVARAAALHQMCWWVAPTFRNTLTAWDELQRLGRMFPGAQIIKDQMLVTFPGGGQVQVVSGASPQNLRGAGLDFVVLDEAAWAEEALWTDVLQPALMDKSGDAMLISTPKGMNWFYREYQRGLREEDGYLSFHFTSYDNPHIPKENIDRLKKTLSAMMFSQEILAEFVADSTSVFRFVEEVLMADGAAEPKPIPYKTYVMGVDWGRKHDYTAISVWNATDKYEVELDRFNEIGFDLQLARIRRLIHKWGVSLVHAEENSMGTPNVERMQSSGLPVRAIYMTNPLKKRLVESLATAIEKAEVGLLPDEAARNELMAYTETVNEKTGVIRYSAPAGMHDDTVVARMLAFQACRGTTRVGMDIMAYA